MLARRSSLTCGKLERVTRIELALSAWEAERIRNCQIRSATSSRDYSLLTLVNGPLMARNTILLRLTSNTSHLLRHGGRRASGVRANNLDGDDFLPAVGRDDVPDRDAVTRQV